MKKRYLFVAVTMLIVGLIFTGCDLFEPGTSSGNGEKYEKLIIRGTAEGGTAERKEVRTEFSTTRTVTKTIMTPMSEDSYEIYFGNNKVSSGKISVSGNTAAQTIRFIPYTGNQFNATLDTANSSLTFPSGIPTPTETIMGYLNEGSSSGVPPEFDAGGDLDSTAITLTAGQSATLTVSAKTNSGGTPYYQWYRSTQNSLTGTAIPGATEKTYVISANTAGDGIYYYYAKVGNASGGVLPSKTKEVKIAANKVVVVGNGEGMTPFYNLKEAIRTLLGTNDSIAYTVNFAMDLPYPLLVDMEAFPGTGKLTIKSSVTFTKGIYITRSEVELNGLNMAINDVDNAARYYRREPCAVVISDRYYLDTGHSPQLGNYREYNAYQTKAIKKVSIVNCNIGFSASYSEPITGIYVDPYTAGRTTGTSDTRVRITGTTVDVFNTDWWNAQCFVGNNTDFSNNMFTSTGKVAHFIFLIKLTYGDSSSTNTVSFSNNKFTSSAVDDKAFEVHVNAAARIASPDYYPDCAPPELVAIKDTCKTYGAPDHKFGELASIYRRLIEILFDQIPSPAGKELLMVDDYDAFYSGTANRQDVFYIMDSRDGIIKRP